MRTKKVPLVVYEDERRKVIGEAVVDYELGYYDVTATITDDEYKTTSLDPQYLTIGFSPHPTTHRREPDEALSIPPPTFEGRVPNDGLRNGPIRSPKRNQRGKGR